MKSYNYINDLGCPKRIDIDVENPKDNKYYSIIWNMQNGELCGSGYNSKEELIDFLMHYGINADF